MALTDYTTYGIAKNVLGSAINTPVSSSISTRRGKDQCPSGYIPKDGHIISSLIGISEDGRYIHKIRDGKATYHPRWYSADGKCL